MKAVKKACIMLTLSLVVFVLAAPVATYAADSKSSTSSTTKKKSKKEDGFTKSMKKALKPIKKYAIDEDWEEVNVKKVKKTKNTLYTSVEFVSGRYLFRTQIRTKKKNGKYTSTWWIYRSNEDKWVKVKTSVLKNYLGA